MSTTRRLEVMAALLASATLGCNGMTPSTSTKTKTASATAAPANADRFAFFSNLSPEPNSVATLSGPGTSPPSAALLGELAIDSTNGELSSLGSVGSASIAAAAGTSPNALAVSPDGERLELVEGNGPGTGKLLSFAIDTTTGSLAATQPATPLSLDAFPDTIALARDGSIVVGDVDGPLASLGSTLTSLPPPPTTGGCSQLSVAVVGSFVYQSYFDLSSGTPAGQGVSVLGSMTPSSIFIASLSSGGRLGTAAPIEAEPVATSVYGSPTGKFVYLSDVHGITVCTPDPVTGALTKGALLPFNANSTLTFDPTGTLAFAWGGGTNPMIVATDVTAFSIDSATGELTRGPSLSVSAFLGFAIDRLGRFAYLTTDTTPYTAAQLAGGPPPASFRSTIQAYAIGAKGSLTASGKPLTLTAASPVWLVATAP